MVKKSILAKVGDVIDYKLIRDGYKTGKGNVVVTAEMDTKTTIVADVPSTAYTSNLDYEVDISGENPPIINIKNDITCPDDTVISKGKYLFYDIGQEYYVKNTNWKPEFAEHNGYTIVGSPTISSEFIMTNFNKSNYISTPKLDYSSPFTLEMHLKFSSYPSGWVFKSSVDCSLDTYFSNSMIVAIGNGSNYHDMAITPSLPFDGKMILKWDGSTYTYTAIDEVSNTTYGPVTYSSSSIIPSSPMKIGYKYCDYIDLKKFIFTSSDSSKSYRVVKDESVFNIPGIKDFTLNDNGTELTTKLFDYHYKTQSEFVNNTNKVGNIIVNELTGVASGFTSSAKLKLEKSTYFTNERKIYTKVKTGKVSGTSEFLWNYSLDKGVGVYSNYWRIWDNGGIYSTSVSPNTSYWTCVLQNASGSTLYVLQDDGQYTSSTLPDLDQWTKACSTQGIIFGDNDFCYGGNTVETSEYWTGTIDLLNSWIDTDGEKRFLAYFTKPQNEASLYINSEKDDNLYYEIQNLNLNISKIGTPTINNEGIASNFSTSNYLDLPYNFSQSVSGQHWEAAFKFIYIKSSENQSFLGGDWGSYTPDIYISPESKLSLNLGSTGSSYDIAEGISGNIILNENNVYYIKVSFDGTNYKTYISEDGQTYTNDINIESSVNIVSSTYKSFIGCRAYREWPFKGTIDLTKSYIQIGTNEKKYFAETIKKRYDIPSLYSEFIDNITIPAHALYEYVNGEWKLSGATPVITQDITVNANDAEITMKEIEE